MRRFRYGKIVATLGPATSDEVAISALFEAGADVFRMNFSHGGHEDHATRIGIIRELESQFHRPIGIVADLQGPKLRVGEFADGAVLLQPGNAFRLDLDSARGDSRRASLPHPEVFRALEPRMRLLMDDGRIHLEVAEVGEDYAVTKVITGGELSNHKGVNVPDTVLELSPLTVKDREDMRFALKSGVDWIALSFVQRPEDVAAARKLIAGRAGVLAKLEKPMALKSLEEIVSLSDAIMVARGDLGVEMPAEEVPIQQKRIISACRSAGKPVIVATQMLDSMVHSPTPTRAEASDVATAIYDGADAVMLSAETAVGSYPVEVVRAMANAAVGAESHPVARTSRYRQDREFRAPQETIALSAMYGANHFPGVRGIATHTETGATPTLMSRLSSGLPIFALSRNPETLQRLALCRGVIPLYFDITAFDIRDIDARTMEFLSDAGFVTKGDHILMTMGTLIGKAGATNSIKLLSIG